MDHSQDGCGQQHAATRHMKWTSQPQARSLDSVTSNLPSLMHEELQRGCSIPSTDSVRIAPNTSCTRHMLKCTMQLYRNNIAQLFNLDPSPQANLLISFSQGYIAMTLSPNPLSIFLCLTCVRGSIEKSLGDSNRVTSFSLHLAHLTILH